MGKSTIIPKTSPEEFAAEFLKEHMSGPEIYKLYEKWCLEKYATPVKPAVFLFQLCKHFGAIK